MNRAIINGETLINTDIIEKLAFSIYQVVHWLERVLAEREVSVRFLAFVVVKYLLIKSVSKGL